MRVNKKTRGVVERQKEHDPSKLPSIVIESFLASSTLDPTDDPELDNRHAEFLLDKEQLEEEFGIKLTNADIRRALRRIGDVTLVDVVNPKKGKPLLSASEFGSLRGFLRRYKGDPDGSSTKYLFGYIREDGEMIYPTSETPFFAGNHHEAVKITKWKNARYENVMKIAEHNVNTRIVRICGSRYPRSNRTRSASFVEFSTNDAIQSGSHTVGGVVERSSYSKSDSRREFGEACFFLTIDIEEHTDPNGQEHALQRFYLVFVREFNVRVEMGLSIVKKIPTASRTAEDKKTNYRRYVGEGRWLDVDDVVDLVGLIYCKTEEYICWRDACWDAIARNRSRPFVWRFRDAPYTQCLASINESSEADLRNGVSGTGNDPPASFRIRRLVQDEIERAELEVEGARQRDMEDGDEEGDPLFGSTDLDGSDEEGLDRPTSTHARRPPSNERRPLRRRINRSSDEYEPSGSYEVNTVMDDPPKSPASEYTRQSNVRPVSYYDSDYELDPEDYSDESIDDFAAVAGSEHALDGDIEMEDPEVAEEIDRSQRMDPLLGDDEYEDLFG